MSEMINGGWRIWGTFVPSGSGFSSHLMLLPGPSISGKSWKLIRFKRFPVKTVVMGEVMVF